MSQERETTEAVIGQELMVESPIDHARRQILADVARSIGSVMVQDAPTDLVREGFAWSLGKVGLEPEDVFVVLEGYEQSGTDVEYAEEVAYLVETLAAGISDDPPNWIDRPTQSDIATNNGEPSPQNRTLNLLRYGLYAEVPAGALLKLKAYAAAFHSFDPDTPIETTRLASLHDELSRRGVDIPKGLLTTEDIFRLVAASYQDQVRGMRREYDESMDYPADALDALKDLNMLLSVLTARQQNVEDVLNDYNQTPGDFERIISKMARQVVSVLNIYRSYYRPGHTTSRVRIATMPDQVLNEVINVTQEHGRLCPEYRLHYNAMEFLSAVYEGTGVELEGLTSAAATMTIGRLATRLAEHKYPEGMMTLHERAELLRQIRWVALHAQGILPTDIAGIDQTASNADKYSAFWVSRQKTVEQLRDLTVRQVREAFVDRRVIAKAVPYMNSPLSDAEIRYLPESQPQTDEASAAARDLLARLGVELPKGQDQYIDSMKLAASLIAYFGLRESIRPQRKQDIDRSRQTMWRVVLLLQGLDKTAIGRCTGATRQSVKKGIDRFIDVLLAAPSRELEAVLLPFTGSPEDQDNQQ